MLLFTIIETSSFILGLLGLSFLFKNRKGYLKRNEALWILLSISFILYGIPDFEFSVAMSIKLAALALFLAFTLGAVSYLMKSERSNGNVQIDDETSTLMDKFISKNKAKFSLTKEYILILIPAYNEANNLKQILRSAPGKVFNLPVKIIVIDDGSSDLTSRSAEDNGALAITLPKNRGGGYALLTGFEAAKRLQAAYVVTMDADGQHEFSDLENIIEPLLNQEAELVLGNRFNAQSTYSNQFRSIGIKLFNLIITIFLGRQFNDCSNSYRSFTLDALKKLDTREKRHHTAELVIRAMKKELKVIEIPIHVKDRISGKSKKGNSFLYALRFGKTILTSWWRA